MIIDGRNGFFEFITTYAFTRRCEETRKLTRQNATILLLTTLLTTDLPIGVTFIEDTP